MPWSAIVALGAGSYLLRAVGMNVLAGRELPAAWTRILDLVPVALLSAVVALQTLTAGNAVVVDARVVGLGAAVGALVLRAPVPVVLVVGLATTALVRATGLLA